MFRKHILPAIIGITLGVLLAWLMAQGIDASGWDYHR